MDIQRETETYSKLSEELREAIAENDEKRIAEVKAKRAAIRAKLPMNTETAYGLMS